MDENFPRPVLDSDSRPFWEGLQRHELWIQYCSLCHQHIFYPRSICPHCFSDDLVWKQSHGRGTIYSYTVVHTAFGPFAEETPYVVALVALDEGVRMMTRIVGVPGDIEIGRKVVVTFADLAEDLTLPYFRLDVG
ncbi:MAG: Zn-ribbon domain-containing OB-fold protein [Alicyclobacillaceae bacterium]|nr:Zn-ribbon domain-containing OB-fold protein [Alicyclobacillaceae bacterium]